MTCQKQNLILCRRQSSLEIKNKKIGSLMCRYEKCLIIKIVDKFQRSLWMPSEGIRCAWLPRKERESRNKIGLASNRKTDDQQKIQMVVHTVSYTATKTSGKISMNRLRNICRVAWKYITYVSLGQCSIVSSALITVLDSSYRLILFRKFLLCIYTNIKNLNKQTYMIALLMLWRKIWQFFW